MPPRYAYWTILIDDTPTAFRAREREELLPTFHQLQRKNKNVAMQWFARGRLWESREAEHDDFQRRKRAASAPFAKPPAGEARGGDWRPGGTHKDPRDRFKKKNRPERAWSDSDVRRDREKLGPPRGDRPWQDRKPAGAPPAIARGAASRRRSAARRSALEQQAGRRSPARRSAVEQQAARRRARAAIGRGRTSKPGGGAPTRRSAMEQEAAWQIAPRGDRPWKQQARRRCPAAIAHGASKPPAIGRAAIGRGTEVRQARQRRSALANHRRGRAAIATVAGQTAGQSRAGDRPWSNKPPAVVRAATGRGATSHRPVASAAIGRGPTRLVNPSPAARRQTARPPPRRPFRPEGGERKPWRDKPAGPSAARLQGGARRLAGPSARARVAEQAAAGAKRPWSGKPAGGGTAALEREAARHESQATRRRAAGSLRLERYERSAALGCPRSAPSN